MQNFSFDLYDLPDGKGGFPANNTSIFRGSKIQPLMDDSKLDAAKVQRVKEKILRQIANMYKSTRMAKYAMQEVGVHSPAVIEYRKLKGLVLNIEKRVCWYLNLQPEAVKCLTLAANSKGAKADLTSADFASGKFHYYIKAIITDGENKFTFSLPLIGLNIKVA